MKPSRSGKPFPRALLAALLSLSLLLSNVSLAAGEEYIVQPGDTLYRIATSHGTTVESIAARNGIANPNVIQSGQRLALPDAGISPTSEQPPAPQLVANDRAPSGSLLGARRVLTYYGNPYSDRMGILGELDMGTLVARLKNAARLYEQAGSDRPVQPAIEFIATVAQAGPGLDGKYRLQMPTEEIEKYSQLAADNGMLLILDVQVGHSTVEEELEPLMPFLRQAHVHLALDPEFDMWPGQLPGEEIGHMTAAEINYAQNILADIVATTGGPSKLLIVHQFTENMLPDKSAIANDPRVDVAVVMDGFGGRDIKEKHYGMFVRDDAPEFGGIKMFFRQDVNMFEPEDVLALDPPPDVIIYQ